MSGVKRFRTKVVEIEAIQWTGDNEQEIQEFTDNDNFEVIHEDDRPYLDDPEATASIYDKLHSTWILVLPNQWIIKGTKDEFYPCHPETFEWKYEEIDS